MAETLGFLIGDVARLFRRRFDERARTIGVTRPQWRMLFTLLRNEGANQGALAELLDVEPITLCRMVDRLQEAGLVERRPDPDDRRAWRIYLTEKARPIVVELRALGDALFAEAVRGLDEDDRERLADMLETLRANLAERQNELAEQAING